MRPRGIITEKGKERAENRRLYNIYYCMLDRCANQKNKRWNVYGGRGITVCEDWIISRSAFINWAKVNGYSSVLQLDRRDNNKGYSPDNCRWVTQKVNCRNTSRNKIVVYNGESRPLCEWVEILGINYQRASYRLNIGWDANDVFSPINNNPKTKNYLAEKRLKERLKSIIDSSLVFFEAA